MDSPPLSTLSISAASVSDDLAFVALGDLIAILEEMEDVETRLVGATMLTLHILRWDLTDVITRETRDADVGMPVLAGRVFDDAATVLDQKGYKQTSQYRYERVVTDIPVSVEDGERRATLDILAVPSDALSRAGSAAPGSGALDMAAIAEALNQDPIFVEVSLERLNRQVLGGRLPLASELSALSLKAFAWRSRQESNDAEDMWRSLEVANAAGVRREDWLSDEVGAITFEVYRDVFSEVGGPGMSAIRHLQNLNRQATQNLHTRIRALMKRIM